MSAKLQIGNVEPAPVCISRCSGYMDRVDLRKYADRQAEVEADAYHQFCTCREGRGRSRWWRVRRREEVQKHRARADVVCSASSVNGVVKN